MKSNLPVSNKLKSLLEPLVLENLDKGSDVDLIIILQNKDISVRQLGAFLLIIDRFFGRLSTENFNSYALSEKKHLKISEIKEGSTILIIENLLERLNSESLIIFYLLINFLKTVIKAGSESILKISEAYNTYEKSRLIRYIRKSLKEEIEADEKLKVLDNKSVLKLVKILEGGYVKEKKYLAASSKFARKNIKNVQLKSRKK